MSDENQIVEKAIEEPKRYQLTKNIDYDKIKTNMINDSLKDNYKQRFGFFSILHSNFLGDQFYSSSKKIMKDSNGKIITEPKGIYAKASKKGKFVDSYFDAGFIKENKEIRDRVTQLAKIENEAKLEKVKKSKEKSGFKINFKPAGVKEYKDLIYPDTMNYKQQIWKEPERGKSIDFKNRKVNNDKRGIYTQPAKNGAASYRGVLFSYDKTPKELLKHYEEVEKKALEEKLLQHKAKRENKVYKKPFMPNNVSKCDTFQNAKELYGLPQSYLSNLNKSFELRHSANKTKLPKIVQHDKSFRPASLTKSVSN